MHTRYKTFIDMAQICFDHKDYLRAVKYASKAMKYNAISREAHFITGISLYYLEDYNNAKDELESFLMVTRHDETDKRIFDCNFILAHCYYNLKEYKQSIASYNTCVYQFKFSASNDDYIIKQKSAKENSLRIIKEKRSKLLTDSGLVHILTENDNAQLWGTILDYYDNHGLEEHSFNGENFSFIIFSSINNSIGKDKIIKDEWYFKKVNESQYEPTKTISTFDNNNYKSISIQRPSVNVNTVNVTFLSLQDG